MSKQTRTEADAIWDMQHSPMTWKHWALIIVANIIVGLVINAIRSA